MGRVNLAVSCLIFLLFALLPRGLASPPLTGTSSLAGTAWVLESLDRKPLLDAQLTLDLRNGAFGGYSGCNRYGGTYRVSETTFVIASYQMTMLGCAQEVLRREAAYAAALGRATRYRVVGNRLELAGRKGHMLLVFSRKSASRTRPAYEQLTGKGDVLN